MQNNVLSSGLPMVNLHVLVDLEDFVHLQASYIKFLLSKDMYNCTACAHLVEL